MTGGYSINLDSDLTSLSRVGLEDEIRRLRASIRYAAQTYNDSRCFLDFFRLFDLLPEGRRCYDTRILTKEDFVENCGVFYDCMKIYLENPDMSIDEIYQEWERTCPYASAGNK